MEKSASLTPMILHQALLLFRAYYHSVICPHPNFERLTSANTKQIPIGSRAGKSDIQDTETGSCLCGPSQKTWPPHRAEYKIFSKTLY